MPLKLVQLCAKYICRSLIDYAGRFRYSTYFPTLPSEITHLLLRTLEEHGLLNLDTLKLFRQCAIQELPLALCSKKSESWRIRVYDDWLSEAAVDGSKSYHGANLRVIDLTNAYRVTNEGLKTLLESARLLECLILTNCKLIDDDPFENFQGFPSLRILKLNGTRISNRFIVQHATKMPQLLELEVSGTRVTAQGVMAIANNLPNLRSLQLKAVRMDDTVIGSDLAKLRFLRVLELNFTGISSDITALKSLKDLEELFLAVNSGIDDSSVAALSDLQKLRRINLSRTSISDKAFLHIAKLENLEFLDVSGTRITDDAITAIKNLVNLREIILNYTEITDTAVNSLVVAFVNLEKLHITHCNFVSNHSMGSLQRLRKLKELHLGSRLITNACVKSLSEIPNLLYLSLWDTQITAAGLEILLLSMKLESGMHTSPGTFLLQSKAIN